MTAGNHTCYTQDGALMQVEDSSNVHHRWLHPSLCFEWSTALHEGAPCEEQLFVVGACYC